MNIAGKMQALAALVLMGSGIVVAGCKSAPDLTQQQAQTLIQAKYDAAPGAPLSIVVNDLGMQEGVTAQYWVGTKRYPNGYWADLKLTPAGAKAMTLPGGGDTIQWRPLSPQDPQYSIALNSVALTHLKARGLGEIQDSGSNKTVTFTEDVDLTALPQPLQGIAHNPGNRLSTKRTATFALNNGAWALQSIE